MKWLKGLRLSGFRPSWEFAAKKILWRLFPYGNRCFIGEERDIDSKLVTFFCLDQKTGRVIWNNIAQEEGWWIGIEDVYDDHLFLHGYATPDLPEHSKIFVLDLHSGKLTWRNADLKYLFIYDGILYTSAFQNNIIKYNSVNYKTGEISSELSEDEVMAERAKWKSQIRECVRYPSTLLPDGLDNPALNDLTGKDEPADMVEYYKYADTLVVGKYRKVSAGAPEQVYEQSIKFYDINKGKMVYEDLLDKSASLMLPDMFFNIDNFIYYVKDRSILKAVELKETR